MLYLWFHCSIVTYYQVQVCDVATVILVFLVSQMDGANYVPISVLSNFNQVRVCLFFIECGSMMSFGSCSVVVYLQCSWLQRTLGIDVHLFVLVSFEDSISFV